MIKPVENSFNSIQKYIETLEIQNQHLLEKNKKLKDEHYKDIEMSKMQSRLDKVQKEYYRGFPISEEENNRIRSWMNKHDEEVHNAHTLSEKLRLGGCCGGRYSYHFTPTSIGTIGTVKCSSCGAEFTFQDMV